MVHDVNISHRTRTLKEYPDLDSLSDAVASAITEICKTSVHSSGRFNMALSGGSTPRALYRRLAEKYSHDIPWQQVHLFWSDERYVSLADSRSNYHMAEEAMLRRLPIPLTNIHPYPTHIDDIRQAAKIYEESLRSYFTTSWPMFDLLLLGLGEDGHTASLFPDSPVLSEQTRWIVPSVAPTEPAARLTLTIPALCHSTNTFILVSGGSKASALEKAFTTPKPTHHRPITLIHPENGQLTWWVDKAATALLPSRMG